MLRLWLCLLTFVSALQAETPAADSAEAERTAFFEKRIRPVLVQRCYECHSAEADDPKGGLLLDSRDAMRRGGESGEAVVPGDVDASLLIAAVRYESLEMPPEGKLPPEVIADFERWVEMGAPDPREGPAVSTSETTSAVIDWDAARQFWAFRPPQPHAPPAVQQPDWPRSPVDHFILSRLEAEGLTPNPPADAQTLLRRLSFDLIGLPPTVEESEQFAAAATVSVDAAVAQAVDRLLASPHFGERWAALWLDVMRYAEDQAHIVGDNKELFFPNAYRYRDWVIAAFNDDLPYDEFLRRQLAADVLYPEEPDSHVALGLIGLGPKYYRRGSPEVMAEEWENQVDTLTQGLQGLTVACARCHDHKFDPVTTADYYALAGVFAGTELFNQPLTPDAKRDKNGHADEPAEALHIVREKDPVDLHVMIRGDVNNRGPKVPRGFVQVLCADERTAFQTGSGRKELAEAIASPDNPLTARVFVNRVWGELFGRGLVRTPSNFGQLGERPSHPELLDDLAWGFMQQGWSLKRLVRELAASATYRQASTLAPRTLAVDPDNVWLGRMPRRRLSIEQWRDALLSAAGRLDPQVGGPSIDPGAADALRRTVYAERSRLKVHPLLKTFDFPDPNAHAARRVETTTPLQKLFALNSPFMLRLAEEVVSQLPQDRDAPERVTALHRRVFGREPSPEEQSLGEAFLSRDDAAAWVDYAQVLLASHELLYLD